MVLNIEEKDKVLKRCQELKIKTKSKQGVQLPWKTLIQKCLVHDLPDAQTLLPSTSLEDLIIKKDKKGEHYWSRIRHGPKRVREISLYPSQLTEHELLKDYQPLRPDTMIPLDLAVSVYKDYLDVETLPEFLEDPKYKKYIKEQSVPYALLMGEDAFDVFQKES